jgi:hypothetical protein
MECINPTMSHPLVSATVPTTLDIVIILTPIIHLLFLTPTQSMNTYLQLGIPTDHKNMGHTLIQCMHPIVIPTPGPSLVRNREDLLATTTTAAAAAAATTTTTIHRLILQVLLRPPP